MGAELERIVSNPHFQASERRRAFLRFIVSETLSGRGESLKGYAIALAVFGRGVSFYLQADPVVRLEARRLRRDLDSYYVEAGQYDPVRISIPNGSYVPNFDWHHVPPLPTSAGHQSSDVPPDVLQSFAIDANVASKPRFLRNLPIVANSLPVPPLEVGMI